MYVAYAESFLLVATITRLLVGAYEAIGFKWGGLSAYVVTAALISSFVANSVRRFLEGTLFGWPQFLEHDIYSLVRALSLIVGYGLMMYFVIGYFGEKYASKTLDLIDIFLIASYTYIAGLLVDFVDDAFSAMFCMLRGGIQSKKSATK